MSLSFKILSSERVVSLLRVVAGKKSGSAKDFEYILSLAF